MHWFWSPSITTYFSDLFTHHHHKSKVSPNCCYCCFGCCWYFLSSCLIGDLQGRERTVMAKYILRCFLPSAVDEVLKETFPAAAVARIRSYTEITVLFASPWPHFSPESSSSACEKETSWRVYSYSSFFFVLFK